MHLKSFFALLLLAAAVRVNAATPSAAQLLPPDTLAVVTVPDWAKAVAYWQGSPQGKLWRDPALRPFRENLAQRWQEDLVMPLEREIGLKLADYLGLLQGQVTIAWTQNGWGTRPDASPGMLILADAKDKQDALKSALAELRKKWIDAGKQVKSERIRDVEFTTLLITDEWDNALDKVFPGEDEADGDELEEEPASSPSKTEISFGQSGSLLIVGKNLQDIEKILVRQAGGTAPALADEAIYSNHSARFRGSIAFAWVNFSSVYAFFEKQLSGPMAGGLGQNPLAPRPDRILRALGLNGLKSITAGLNGDAEGPSAELFLAVPEAGRQGLFRVVVPEQKEAAPPAFVGAGVAKFGRWRIDGQKAWNTLESMLTAVSPELGGLLKMGIQAAGKDRDPNFDLRKSLIGNLGDDFITLEKSPRSSSLTDLKAPPTLFLIGSPKAEELVQGIRAATSLMPLAGGEPSLKEREFLGRKIYSLALPSAPDGNEPETPAAARTVSFAASGGYAAISVDAALLEEYLRSTETTGKSLRETPELAEAAQKVGGMNTGHFGYEDHAQTVRIWLESAKKESAALDRLLSLAPLAGSKEMTPEELKNMTEWLDVSLLPPFQEISKYFHFMVSSLSASEEGLSWKIFAPVPPRLK